MRRERPTFSISGRLYERLRLKAAAEHRSICGIVESTVLAALSNGGTWVQPEPAPTLTTEERIERYWRDRGSH